MKSSIIVGAIVVAIGLFGGWWLLKSKSSGQETLTPTPLQSQPGSLGATSPELRVTESPTASPSVALTPSVSPTTSTTGATVTITDAGFSPATITVKPGTTVMFVNNGSGLHWPASNPHPTHTDLPGFDAKHGLAPGESYAFVFNKIGAWGYHDHLNLAAHGTVIVQL